MLVLGPSREGSCREQKLVGTTIEEGEIFDKYFLYIRHHQYMTHQNMTGWRTFPWRFGQGVSKPNLSSREMDEMIDDWTPEPLVPPLSEEQTADAESTPVRSLPRFGGTN